MLTKNQTLQVVQKALNEQSKYNDVKYSQGGGGGGGGSFSYVGVVSSYTNLPTNPASGDMYKLENAGEANNAGDFALFNGSSWLILSGFIDTSNLLTKDELWLE